MRGPQSHRIPRLRHIHRSGGLPQPEWFGATPIEAAKGDDNIIPASEGWVVAQHCGRFRPHTELGFGRPSGAQTPAPPHQQAPLAPILVQIRSSMRPQGDPTLGPRARVPGPPTFCGDPPELAPGMHPTQAHALSQHNRSGFCRSGFSVSWQSKLVLFGAVYRMPRCCECLQAHNACTALGLSLPPGKPGSIENERSVREHTLRGFCVLPPTSTRFASVCLSGVCRRVRSQRRVVKVLGAT